jgi:C4-dicarboxylate-specific signal transduction histidine kinase
MEMREDRFARFGISVHVQTKADFTIKFNTGHLLQVVDNLMRNSEYWLRQYAAHHEGAPLQIYVVIAGPEVLVWDTGPGVRPAIEKTLFEAFVTDKPRGQGNGLGLYIVTQLLERAGCSIRLSPERNEAKRRYKFVLDMSGAMT